MIEIDTEAGENWIHCDSPLYAGRALDIVINNRHGPVDVEVYVDNAPVLRHRCPDPPCHESIEMDSLWNNRQLVVIVRDESAQIQTWSGELVERGEDLDVGGLEQT